MNSFDYKLLIAYAGRHLAWAHPWPVPASVPFSLNPEAAIYVACDVEGTCRYVGSVTRAQGFGLAGRIAEHLGEFEKRRLWHTIWVLPLHAETPVDEVRRIEGVAGAHLGPSDNKWLPQPRPEEAAALP